MDDSREVQEEDDFEYVGVAHVGQVDWMAGRIWIGFGFDRLSRVTKASLQIVKIRKIFPADAASPVRHFEDVPGGFHINPVGFDDALVEIMPEYVVEQHIPIAVFPEFREHAQGFHDEIFFRMQAAQKPDFPTVSLEEKYVGTLAIEFDVGSHICEELGEGNPRCLREYFQAQAVNAVESLDASEPFDSDGIVRLVMGERVRSVAIHAEVFFRNSESVCEEHGVVSAVGLVFSGDGPRAWENGRRATGDHRIAFCRNRDLTGGFTSF
jgi:hypothetical protein